MAVSKIKKTPFTYTGGYNATTDSNGQVQIPVNVIDPFNDVFIIKAVTGSWLARQVIDNNMNPPKLVLQFCNYLGNVDAGKNVRIYYSK